MSCGKSIGGKKKGGVGLTGAVSTGLLVAAEELYRNSLKKKKRGGGGGEESAPVDGTLLDVGKIMNGGGRRRRGGAIEGLDQRDGSLITEAFGKSLTGGKKKKGGIGLTEAVSTGLLVAAEEMYRKSLKKKKGGGVRDSKFNPLNWRSNRVAPAPGAPAPGAPGAPGAPAPQAPAPGVPGALQAQQAPGVPGVSPPAPGAPGAPQQQQAPQAPQAPGAPGAPQQQAPQAPQAPGAPGAPQAPAARPQEVKISITEYNCKNKPYYEVVTDKDIPNANQYIVTLVNGQVTGIQKISSQTNVNVLPGCSNEEVQEPEAPAPAPPAAQQQTGEGAEEKTEGAEEKTGEVVAAGGRRKKNNKLDKLLQKIVKKGGTLQDILYLDNTGRMRKGWQNGGEQTQFNMEEVAKEAELAAQNHVGGKKHRRRGRPCKKGGAAFNDFVNAMSSQAGAIGSIAGVSTTPAPADVKAETFASVQSGGKKKRISRKKRGGNDQLEHFAAVQQKAVADAVQVKPEDVPIPPATQDGGKKKRVSRKKRGGDEQQQKNKQDGGKKKRVSRKKRGGNDQVNNLSDMVKGLLSKIY